MATKYAIKGGGNWSGATWATASNQASSDTTKPVNGDVAVLDQYSGSVTVDTASACTTLTMTGYAGTLAFSTNTLTVAGNVTLGGSITTGSGGKLVISAASTITPNGVTLPCAVDLGTGTKTLAADLTVSGLLSATTSVAVNGSSYKLILSGGLYISGGNLSGTATVELTGGTMSNNGSYASTLDTNLRINGNVTLTSPRYKTGTITYVSGTVSGADLFMYGSCTILSDLGATKLTWNTLNFYESGTLTLTSNITVSGNIYTYTGKNGVINGAYTATCGGINATANLSGNTPITITGGNFEGAGTISTTNISIAGNVAINTLNLSGVTLTYTSGTVTSTGTQTCTGCTLNTSGMTWDVLRIVGTTTLSSNLAANTLYATTAVTLSGVYTSTCNVFNAFNNFTLASGATIAVATSIFLKMNGAVITALAFATSSASTHAHLNYSGTLENLKVFNVDFTDIDASGSTRPIYELAGSTTRCTNIIPSTFGTLLSGGVSVTNY